MKYFYLIILSIIWGTYYISNKISVQTTSVFSVGLFIRIFTFFLLIIIMFFSKELKNLKVIKYNYKKLFIIGFFGFLLDVFAFLGLTYSTASNGAILLKTDVLFANVISLILGITFGLFDWIGTLLMFGGIIFVLNIDVSNFNFNFGDIFFILSGLFISLNAFIIKSLQNSENPVKGKTIAFYNNFFAMIFFMIFSFVQRGGEIFSFNRESLFPLVIAGICQTLVYLVYYFNIKIFPVWIVVVFLLFMPVFVTAVGVLFLNEKVVLIQYFGFLLILSGAISIIYSQNKKYIKISKNCSIKKE